MCTKAIYLISSVALVLGLAGVADGQSGTGVRGEYYHWTGASPPAREDAFRDLLTVRIDPQIYCYWNPGFQATHPDGLKPDFEIVPPVGLRADNFAVRWLGEIEALNSEAYTFITGSDDGVRLWFNGELIIDNWTDHDRAENTSDPIQLVAGQRYPFVMEGYEAGGEAEWQLYWQSASTAREPVPQRVLYPVIKAQDYPASDPVPADGAVIRQTWVSMQWKAGPTAVSHDVYFGEDFDQVKAGTPDTFRGNRVGTDFILGFPGFPYPDGLVPGTTYYWRIDEVNEADPNSPWMGAVWRFTVAPVTAFGPNPADGADAVKTDARLSWQIGFDAKLHYVHFGDDFDTVNNATAGTPTGLASHTPGPLVPAKVYYWRIDEFDGANTHKGDVWSFSTVGAVGSPKPPYGAVDVRHNPILTWVAGDGAASHQVYFGTDKAAVRNANTGSPEYKGPKALGDENHDPGLLEWNSTYYWRVDEVNTLNPAGPWKGNVWVFTTADFFVVDDFEGYNDIDPPNPASNRIFDSWIDGFGTTDNGALVGNDLPPYAEQSIVHGGSQSMPYSYDIDGKYAEATLTLTHPRNWTERGVDTLIIWFKGDFINVAAPMYVAVAGATGAPAVVRHQSARITQTDVWTQWQIPLQVFADQGVDLAEVNTIAIGFGDKNNLRPGGSGKMLFDDIRLDQVQATP